MNTDENHEEARRAYFLQQVRSEIRENQYKTNDVVELTGGFTTGGKSLHINALPTIRLTKPEFALFLILAAHGRSLKRLPSPRRIEGGKFLSTDAILDAVDAWRAQEPQLAEFWEDATFINVYRAACELREKIANRGGNRNLIETGPDGGYRLSTSPYNVTITLG